MRQFDGLKNNTNQFIAHITDDNQQKQLLKDHLAGTAQLASKNAAAFAAAEEAYQIGLLHDIGKYSNAFQRRIRGDNIQADHSTAGAKVLFQCGWVEGAFAIAGHHGGLPNGGSFRNDTVDSPTLFGRIKKELNSFEAWKSEIPTAISPQQGPKYPDLFEESMYIRMLYSCLVDADFIDTEHFMTGNGTLRGTSEPLTILLEKVRTKADEWLNAQPSSFVGKKRNEILASCLAHGKMDAPGLFSLTVPTGGGKTFGSLAFAMEHAVRNGLNRIIYVIPYTSIIDQTVDVLSSLLGEQNVLAHYSGTDYQIKDTDHMTELDYRKQLASENWDAPIIVTTAVQFFESLYANRPSKCRKLHNIAKSVLIFDEVQTLPISHLQPCIAAISVLVKNFSASAVLCTATMPDLSQLFGRYITEYSICEIAEDPEELYEALRRTTLYNLGSIAPASLVQELNQFDQVLCVVNRRKTAQELYAALQSETAYCLTTLLCPHDRKRQIREIRARLQNGLPCKVISTSLIEAGVDLDFPAAFREETGLDSILQTAGRCNREGKHSAEASPVYLFSLEGTNAPILLRPNVNALHHTLRKYPDRIASPIGVRAYFSTLYEVKGEEAQDRQCIMKAFSPEHPCLFPFADVAEQFHLIDSKTIPVYLPVGEGEMLCKALKAGQVNRHLFRRLGLYSVEVFPEQIQKLKEANAITMDSANFAILSNISLYHEKTGLSMDIESGAAVFV